MGNGQSKALIMQIGLSAVGVSLILYIWFGPKLPSTPPSSRRASFRSTTEILGLSNLGNSCYVNALLQALAACRYYVDYINKYNEIYKLGSTRDENDPAFRVITALSNANQYINRDLTGNDFIMSREVPKSILSTFNPRSSVSLSTYEEQDSHEIFNIITNTLVEEQKGIQRRQYFDTIQSVQAFDSSLKEQIVSVASSQAVLPRPSKDVDEGFLSLLTESTTPQIVTRASCTVIQPHSSSTHWTDWSNPFVGQFASTFQCLLCNVKMSVKFEEFNDITLSIPQRRSKLTLTEIITHYFLSTIVYDVDCENCSKTAGKPIKSSFCKRIGISKLPRSLCFHINRAEWSGYGSNKIVDFIPFEETIDMGNIDGLVDLLKDNSVSLNRDDVDGDGDTGGGSSRPYAKYRLMSVICHRGSCETGHFITYRRGPRDSICPERWYMVSDRFVNPVLQEQVFLQHAYMLFYDRVEC